MSEPVKPTNAGDSLTEGCTRLDEHPREPKLLGNAEVRAHGDARPNAPTAERLSRPSYASTGSIACTILGP